MIFLIKKMFIFSVCFLLLFVQKVPPRPTTVEHHIASCVSWMLVLSRFSCVRLCTTLGTMARFLSPGDSPGKETGVGCHASRGSL